MNRELLQQAHDLLLPVYGETSNIVQALRQALAAPQPEPVAWAQNPKYGFWCWCLPDEPGAIALYAAPPAAPAPAVPLTDAAYQLLKKGEILSSGDESLDDDCKGWTRIAGIFCGMEYNPTFLVPHRRPLGKTNGIGGGGNG
jgi:hypothetical protein